ncbi:MAG: ATP-binding cassette domain-containing protein [Planctomycetaceae bacterium]|nr:ATP-binding cassette domain-containing protein [Planctomycetaceae bacterium]
MIIIDSLTKRLDGKTALDNISANIKAGQITGLVGPDGAGKTTLLRLLAGLLEPEHGKITVSIRNASGSVTHLDTVRNTLKLKSLFGYMPQRFGLYEDLTVQENLNLYADLQNVVGKERKERFAELLRFTDLAAFTDRLARKLSGGMKQKLGLACVLVKMPKVLLLDEPSVGVDPISRRELRQIVQNLLNDDVTVLWSTAYLDEAERLNDVLLLNEGKMLFFGNPKELMQQLGKVRFEDAFIELLGGERKKESPFNKISPTKRVIRDNEIVVEAKHLTKRFGNFTAVRDNNFAIRHGEIFGLLGPNGAGKSTTFKMLCGLLKPTEGEGFIAGHNLLKSPSRARSRLGYMAQKFSLYGDLTVKQNLSFFAGTYGLKFNRKRSAVNEMLEMFELQQYADTNSSLLPLGFKQRLALACSLMHEPDVLFLDEPTSGVDPLTRREFWGHINALARRGVSVLITTHFMDEAEYCGRIGLIYRGEKIAEDTPAELKRITFSETLEETFIKMIERSDIH